MKGVWHIYIIMKEKKNKKKSKGKILKGLKRVTYLPPYPPQKLTATNTDSGTVKITWARPKGEFEKYILKVTFFIYHYRIIIMIPCFFTFFSRWLCWRLAN